MDDLNKTHGQGDPHASKGEESPSKKITTSDDDDLAPAEMSPWQLPWKAITITIVLLILIAGAVHVVGLASNRIVRLSTASVRKHGAEPGEFRPMGGVLTEALPGSKNAQIQGAASQKLAEGKDLAPTSQIHVDASGYKVPEGYVLIPAGPFWMGAEDSFANFDEKPIHKVYLPPYLIEKNPCDQSRVQGICRQTPLSSSGQLEKWDLSSRARRLPGHICLHGKCPGLCPIPQGPPLYGRGMGKGGPRGGQTHVALGK